MTKDFIESVNECPACDHVRTDDSDWCQNPEEEAMDQLGGW